MRTILGEDARYVHLDCTESEIPTDRPIGRLIKKLFESAPVCRMAFGKFFLTDASGTLLFGMRPCGCHRVGHLRTAEDLMHAARRPELNPGGTAVDLEVLQGAADRFRHHRDLRLAVAAGGDAESLRRFESALPDYPAWAFPCRVMDPGGRASTLTLGILSGAGGSPVGLGRTLDPDTSPSPALREFLATALADAALRDDPYHEAAGPHLGLTYLLLARDEIETAVASSCRQHGCAPGELPLHALPVPFAARERAARMACTARRISVPEGVSAIDTLRTRLS